ncbi:hypothetical protein LguiB_012764 [Lonicera macranthoides]
MFEEYITVCCSVAELNIYTPRECKSLVSDRSSSIHEILTAKLSQGISNPHIVINLFLFTEKSEIQPRVLRFYPIQGEFDYPPSEKDAVLTQLGLQLKTWKKNLRNKYFGKTKESVLAYKDKVPEAVHVSLSAWNTFVEREATSEKLAQRIQAKDNRSKKTDAHYLGRTSYAEKEEICMSTQKRKPDRVELYVDARKHPKTNLCHPGAISDVGLDPSFPRESGGSHGRPSGEAGGIPTTLHGSEKSATGSPSTPTSGPSKYYKLMNLDGSKAIAQVMIVKTAPGSLVHGRPMLPFEVKVNVVKVFPGMGDEPIWKGNQGGVDSLAESEGGYLVWPKYLMEEILGDNRVVPLTIFPRILGHEAIGKISRDLTEASLSGAGLSIIATFSMMLLFGMIVNWKTHLKFPEEAELSSEAKDLTSKLLCNVNQRLGADLVGIVHENSAIAKPVSLCILR